MTLKIKPNYLRIVDLVALCRCANKHIVIVRRFSDDRLEYERHSVTDPTRGVVITSIISNNVGAVESHYERVMSVRDLRRQEELRKEAAKLEAKRQHEEKSSEARESTLIQVDDRKSQPDKETKRTPKNALRC